MCARTFVSTHTKVRAILPPLKYNVVSAAPRVYAGYAHTCARVSESLNRR